MKKICTSGFLILLCIILNKSERVSANEVFDIGVAVLTYDNGGKYPVDLTL